MSRHIQKAAVIGSGTMGSGIAALLAGVGIPVVLLDIAAKGTAPGDPPEERSAIALGNLQTMLKSRPPQLFAPADRDRITPGNLDDDLALLADVDWVIEAIVENLAIKQDLMARLETACKPSAIISTNTSGLPVAAVAEGRGDDFKRRFMGTHFFNPPRYLKLLEIIPHPQTDPDVLAFMRAFGTNVLGKGVVVCKDTPNFIANRFISVAGTFTLNYALDHGYSVDEVDALTGPLIGRPKTGTFRLYDLIGADIMAARQCQPVPRHPRRRSRAKCWPTPGRMRWWLAWWSAAGSATSPARVFTERVDLPDGSKEFWTLDLTTSSTIRRSKCALTAWGSSANWKTRARASRRWSTPTTAPRSSYGICTPST